MRKEEKKIGVSTCCGGRMKTGFASLGTVLQMVPIFD